MYSNEPIKYRKERRKKPDIICRFLEVAVFIVWTVILAVLILLHFSQPQEETFLERLLDVEVRKTVNFTMLNTVFYLLIFLFFFSLISLILNTRRLKRSKDHIRISFIFSLIGSFAGVIIYIFYHMI